jgi:tetratricopeptide (TPR) repeat protein
MSYINDALKKAQKEKDNRYGTFGYVAPFSSGKPKQPWKRRIATFTVVVLVLAVTLLFIEFFYLPAPAVQKPEESEKKITDASLRAAQKTEQLYQDAVLIQSKGDLDKAKTKYLDVLQLDSNHVRALNNLGVVYLAMKNSDKALELFRMAVVLKRDYADPYYNMACLYAQKNDIDQSIWYLKIAASIDAEVKKWVQKDADFKNVIKSPEFKEFVKSKFSPSPAEKN